VKLARRSNISGKIYIALQDKYDVSESGMKHHEASGGAI